MFCPKCGRENPDEAKFCTGCGSAVAVTPSPPTAGATYAGFWVRLAAYVLDALVLFIPITALSLLMSWDMSHSDEFGSSFVVSVIFWWLYYALMESSTHQATLGKKALGAYVTDINGQQLSFARASGRHFAKFLSAMAFLVGFIMIGFTKRSQGLHDILADTLVLRRAP